MTTTLKLHRLAACVLFAVGAILALSGAVAWGVVSSELSDAHITVSEDARHFGGQAVDGPFTAWEQQAIINRHALEATGGKSYAQMDREDPLREVAAQAASLRTSLLASITGFGVAALAALAGLAIALVGALRWNEYKIVDDWAKKRPSGTDA